MKILDTTACSPINILFTKSGHFDFLQLAYKEGIAAAIINAIGESYSSARVYILNGCQMVPGPFYQVRSGYIFYNNEVFINASSSVTAPGTNTVFNIVLTPYTTNADPTDFSDGTPRNVAISRTVVVNDGATGTSTLTGNAQGDYANAYVLYYDTTEIYTLDGATVDFKRSKTLVTQIGLTPGANAFTIDPTGAAPGAELVIITATASATSLTINSPGYTQVKMNTPPAVTGTTTTVLRLKNITTTPFPYILVEQNSY